RDVQRQSPPSAIIANPHSFVIPLEAKRRCGTHAVDRENSKPVQNKYPDWSFHANHHTPFQITG
ncbi:MAG: hypothetical protein WCC66_14920, partial [Rhizobiaceae bacterium]